jgi:molybdopterin-containing oxidoreductase family iron-sulfur binding subunit
MARRSTGNETLQTIRGALHGKTGRVFWRSLDELARTPAFSAFLEAEFPALALAQQGVDRRSMLKAMAASLALASVAGCDGKPDANALPYVATPELETPGNPKWYATAVTPFGYAQPVFGKTYAGRPVKLEGNPDHPASRGATDAFTQAALLDLYDPSRSQFPRYLGQPATWEAVDASIQALGTDLEARQGEGFRLLTGATTSPTLLRQITLLLERYPKARWHVLEAVNDSAWLAASEAAFGRPLERHYQLDACELLVSFDDDLLGPGPRQVVHGLGWAKRRQARQAGQGDCRLLVAEPTPSATGAMAMQRLPASPQRMAALLGALGDRLGLEQGSAIPLSAEEQSWIDQSAAGLTQHPGRSLVTVGSYYPASLHAYALALNDRLGNLNTTLRFTERSADAGAAQSFETLVDDMAAGQVSALWILGANPVYLGSTDPKVGAALQRVPLKLHAGLHYDETAAACHWHLPLPHDLESWSDARAVDGTASIIQPLIQPLYATRSRHELLDRLLKGHGTARQIVQETWQKSWNADFDRRWTASLQRGLIDASAPPSTQAALQTRGGPPTVEEARRLVAVVRPDPSIWDGRFAENAWLQELPKPLTKVTWGNIVLVSPSLAKDHKLRNGDEIEVRHNGRAIRGPAWVMPGQEEHTVTLSLGYGRSLPDSDEEPLGYNALGLGGAQGRWHLSDIEIEATGEQVLVASTQLHQAMDGFDFVRTVDAASLSAPIERAEAPSFYPARPVSDPSWGMSIDLDLCIGCNACVVACVAENNIPMVGKELVAQGREMHWLRVDHYHEGDPANPRSYFQPVPCMHCEQAPCEMGCPVNATVHSGDGLNLQVYNRCIGTRTCSSFCPYKVRHFNWFDYVGQDPESIRAMRNPDVTVRARGVMEKCTYCVQRIQEAKIAAQVAGRPLREGDVVTACQQACPTQAIVFGNIADAASAVSRRKAGNRDYSLLEEANTRPRTTYLARIEDDAPPAAGKT